MGGLASERWSPLDTASSTALTLTPAATKPPATFISSGSSGLASSR